MATSRTTRQVLGLVLAAVLFALGWWVQDGSGSDDSNGTSTTTPTGQVTPSESTYTESPTPTPSAPTPTEQAGTDPHSGLPWVDLGELPAEAKETVALIESDGPFPYPENDGTVFENREEILPLEEFGYYHEYTVPTPGSRDRGARRIVTGMDGEFYWTQDHYSSFERIAL